MWKFSRTKDERNTHNLFAYGGEYIDFSVYSISISFNCEDWHRLLSFGYSTTFLLISVSNPHTFFVYIHTLIAKKEFAENPEKSRYQLKEQTFMKLFSNLWASIAMLLMLLVATSCENSSILPEQPTTPTEPEYVTVSLGLDVELGYEYEPLSRAVENNDLYGIQVYSSPISDAGNAQWTKYAYGLFDTTDSLTIKLIRGYEYKFVAAMVKDGKDKVKMSFGGYGDLFIHDSSGGVFESTLLSTSFIYGQSGLRLLSLAIGESWDNYAVELFYGELESYIPGGNDSKATIELERNGFGAKYKVTGEYAEDGTLEILMTRAPQLNLNLAEDNEVSEIYTFGHIRAAWLDESYTETKTVTLRIAYSDGTTAPLGTHNITFKRNMTTVVNVDLSIGGENGVGVVITDDGEMPEGSEITIEDGQIVDTEIETN
jgi:hypothetical protein